ncbi:hypothetical protein LZ32DRAFT_367713 [Colletotrichum eremochloae]|nr:hypothetical protein LZ32DRAFT_367713 [Colletotrichum eremochloae]
MTTRELWEVALGQGPMGALKSTLTALCQRGFSSLPHHCLPPNPTYVLAHVIGFDQSGAYSTRTSEVSYRMLWFRSLYAPEDYVKRTPVAQT